MPQYFHGDSILTVESSGFAEKQAPKDAGRDRGGAESGREVRELITLVTLCLPARLSQNWNHANDNYGGRAQEHYATVLVRRKAVLFRLQAPADVGGVVGRCSVVRQLCRYISFVAA